MKKSLLALAVLGAFAGVASAQSSVTLDGTVDANARYVKNDGSSRRYSMGTDGINSSQLRFSGREDLGGGLWAGFNWNAGINPDTGTINSRFFSRRSTVSLGGNFGEVRLGRDYTPTFWNNTVYDAFGTNGVGSSLNVQQKGTGTTVRADNSIGYFTPSGIGGAFGQVMVAAGEGGVAAIGNPGRYVGVRGGFGAGPFEIAAAYGQQKFASGATDQKTLNIGGSYNAGVVRLYTWFDRDTQGNDKENRFSFSAAVPIGQSEIHAGYELSKRDNAGVTTKIDQFAVGYIYNLSKRTAVYATAARLNNKNGTANSVAGGTSITAAPVPGTAGGSAKSTGAEFGLRHTF
jgi:predicted porin